MSKPTSRSHSKGRIWAAFPPIEAYLHLLIRDELRKWYARIEVASESPKCLTTHHSADEKAGGFVENKPVNWRKNCPNCPPNPPRPIKHTYGTDLLWALIFFLIHVAWPYIVPEESLPSIVAAWLMWACALFFVARLFLRWCRDKDWLKSSRFIVAVAAATFLYLAATSIWLIAQPTYLYLVPTHNLIDAERRGFFVTQVGPRPLSNVEIAFCDNKSGAIQLEKYSAIDAGPQNPLAPRYFWFTPSTPWDEEYTVTITSSKKPRAIQRLIVRSTHHLIHFATDVRVDGRSTPLIECRDPLLPAS